MLAALFALCSQVAFAADPGVDEAALQLAAFDAARILCIGDQPSDAPRPHPHRAADLPLCPAVVTVALPAVVPEMPALVSPRAATLLLARTDERPPGRGPPPATARVGRPRAPPNSA